MRRQLSRSGNLFCGNNLDFCEGRQLFRGDRAAAQDVDLAVAHGDDGRFNSVLSRPGIDDQRDAAVEFMQNVLRGGGADSTETICARRSQRFSKRLKDLSEVRMRAD